MNRLMPDDKPLRSASGIMWLIQHHGHMVMKERAYLAFIDALFAEYPIKPITPPMEHESWQSPHQAPAAADLLMDDIARARLIFGTAIVDTNRMAVVDPTKVRIVPPADLPTLRTTLEVTIPAWFDSTVRMQP